jgi:hypothetical protein
MANGYVTDLRGDEVVHGLGDLVDHADNVLVGPARLEEVVGLLYHLVQLLSSREVMGLAPPLYVKRMSKKDKRGRRCTIMIFS